MDTTLLYFVSLCTLLLQLESALNGLRQMFVCLVTTGRAFKCMLWVMLINATDLLVCKRSDDSSLAMEKLLYKEIWTALEKVHHVQMHGSALLAIGAHVISVVPLSGFVSIFVFAFSVDASAAVRTNNPCLWCLVLLAINEFTIRTKLILLKLDAASIAKEHASV